MTTAASAAGRSAGFSVGTGAAGLRLSRFRGPWEIGCSRNSRPSNASPRGTLLTGSGRGPREAPRSRPCSRSCLAERLWRVWRKARQPWSMPAIASLPGGVAFGRACSRAERSSEQTESSRAVAPNRKAAVIWRQSDRRSKGRLSDHGRRSDKIAVESGGSSKSPPARVIPGSELSTISTSFA